MNKFSNFKAMVLSQRDSLSNNEKINRQSGNMQQADLEKRTVEEIDAALKALENQ